MAATAENMAALRAEVESLRAENAALRGKIGEAAAVLAGLGTLSLAGGGDGVLLPASPDEDEDKGMESDDEGTLARLAATSPELINDGNPTYAGRKTDVYEVLINPDRSVKYDADGKFTIKKVGMFDFAFEAMYWVVKEKSGNGTLPPGWDESKGRGGMGSVFVSNIFGNTFQAQGYDTKVAKYGVLFPAKQVNEFNKTKYKTSAAFHVVYTTSEQYLLVKRVNDIESKTDVVNVLPAAIRKQLATIRIRK